MNTLEQAKRYMEIVFSGKTPEALTDILHPDCAFQGPFYSFDSAEAYIQSLQASPPEGFQYKIIRAFEEGTTACIFYRFSKGDILTPMAQLFETREGRISSILLIFDSAAF